MLTGVPPNWADFNGRTPLHIAASEGFKRICTLLVDFGGDFKVKDKFGNVPLEDLKKKDANYAS